MASVQGEDAKGKTRQKDGSTNQTMTLTFVPEIERYERPQNMEEHIRTYFESINGINKRIIAEERKIIAQNRNTWPTLPIEERDRLLNDRLISGKVREKYKSNEDYWSKKTPWLAEELLAAARTDKPSVREERTGSMSNDSFSSPFQWRTKSQRNIHFPEVKREKLKHSPETEEQKSNEVAPKQEKPCRTVSEPEQTDKIPNIVEKGIKEKQIKIKHDNVKGNVKESKTASPIKNKQTDEKPKTSLNSNEDVENQDGIPSEQPNIDEKKYLDSSENIFEFLQSWNP